jgi:hypothetical protein
LVAGAATREALLDFIARMIKYNNGKTMIQVCGKVVPFFKDNCLGQRA